jgi:hypothetical protein
MCRRRPAEKRLTPVNDRLLHLHETVSLANDILHGACLRGYATRPF